jgi:hypothetical protein
MQKRIIIVILSLSIIVFSYIFYGKLVRFRFYSSEHGIETMTITFGNLVNYVYNYSEIPDSQTFFKYLKEISSQENDILPVDFHKSLSSLKASDFVFTTDYSYIYVWLFSELKSRKDTLYFTDVPFTDFFFRRGRLVAQYAYPNPCRPDLVYFEKDRKSIKNQELYNKLHEIVREIAFFQNSRNKNNVILKLCCFHVFVKDNKLVIENFYSDLQDQCRFDEELEMEILKNLDFLIEKYPEYDFYIQFYI